MKKMKILVSLICLAALLCGLLAGCGKKITAEEAHQIVLDDLGETLAATAEAPHIHEGTYEGKPCFNIFITVNGMTMQYIVSENGKILHKGAGEHSH